MGERPVSAAETSPSFPARVDVDLVEVVLGAGQAAARILDRAARLGVGRDEPVAGRAELAYAPLPSIGASRSGRRAVRRARAE